MPNKDKNEDAWFWTPEWQKAEAEAQADIDAGRVKRFNTVEEAIAHLRNKGNNE